jgi:hypothetical protein
MVEHWVRHGNVATIVTVVTDPVYLTEPLVKSTDFRLNERPAGGWLWPCEYVDEVAGLKQGYVPHYLPGKSPFQGEFAAKMGIPVEATRGGAETMYPEYRSKMPQTWSTLDRCTRYCQCMNVGGNCALGVQPTRSAPAAAPVRRPQ